VEAALVTDKYAVYKTIAVRGVWRRCQENERRVMTVKAVG
jgi:hypothetical protein